ncbi:hypothetical protein [Pseudaestuariivita atlantica]|uniref:Uncharacterized protein n=1 Tax=Pseudaestuariivita atlantica TaxID=1317121 RepID=A0A0L1JKD1_9RHOB|nr:hypothetical protein [Pseudaestuariivita atlantica]KNG92206.1 hypothetical protein ATO11_18665 [Pseudaestuariivita atlantica]
MANDKVGESAMDERGKGGQHLDLEGQCATDLTGHRFPIAVRFADVPDDLGKLLDMGFEERFRGR